MRSAEQEHGRPVGSFFARRLASAMNETEPIRYSTNRNAAVWSFVSCVARGRESCQAGGYRSVFDISV